LINFWCNFATNSSDLMLRGCGDASSRDTWNFLVLDGCHLGVWSNATIKMWSSSCEFFLKKVMWEWLSGMKFYNWLFQIVPLLDWSSTCTIGERLGFMCLHRWPNRSIHLSFLKWATIYITLSTIILSMNISTNTMCIDMISRYCWCFCLWFLLMYVWCS
jgi:hypothetical protein